MSAGLFEQHVGDEIAFGSPKNPGERSAMLAGRLELAGLELRMAAWAEGAFLNTTKKALITTKNNFEDW